MKEDELSLIDSNILIYSIDSSDKKKHNYAKELLKKCWLGQTNYAISIQNLSEFFVNATKKVAIPITKEKAQEIINNIIEFEGFKILEPTQKTITNAINLTLTNKTEYWDAVIAATMLENNIHKIYTENTKDFSIKNIIAINPFTNFNPALSKE